MGEEVLMHVAQEIVSRLVSRVIDEIGLALGVNDEVRKLRGTVNSIEALLLDAQQKQVKDRTHKLWLEELKEVAFDIEDLFGYIDYKEVHSKIQGHNRVSSFVQNTRLSSKIAHRIKHINQRLADIDKRKTMFNLEHASSSNPVPNHPQTAASSSSSSNPVPNDRPQTAAFVDVSTVVGRESKKDDIVDMLLSNVTATTDDFRTVAIIGFGGIGKTTLAQLAYNDDAVKKHFDLRVWICVSDVFSTTNLFAQILHQITDVQSESSTSRQVFHNKLQSELKNKKFLLVLDDVWNESQKEWDDFVIPLKNFGATGSRVLVTSRSRKVASIVEAKDTCELEGLSDIDCWALLEREAFKAGGPKRTPLLEKIGKEISKNKCKGVPLAAKFLGGLLHSMEGERDWRAIRDAEFQKLPTLPGKEYDDVMGVLKYSFDNLSPTLKTCFSYCAIFPKDYQISKEKLIQLWMAQGFLNCTQGEFTMEDYGNTYFNSLYSKSFFSRELNSHGEVVYYKMHDLVQDLAHFVSKSECLILGDNNETSKGLSKCRHASLISSKPLEALKEGKKLRTIICLKSNCNLIVSGVNTFSDFISLRVLDFSWIECSKFPSSSHCKLKHLRYFDLSYTSIKSLPSSLTSLTSLCIKNCKDLEYLPKGLLRNNNELNDVRIEGCPKLQALQEGLTDDGIEIVAKSSLRKLEIYSCGALKSIPDIRGFTSLQRLEICFCEELETIPKGFLSSLVFLEGLKLFGFPKLKYVIELTQSFKHLREIDIRVCPKFEGFDYNNLRSEQQLVVLPCCHTLKIEECDAVTSIELRSFPSLRVLEITKCRGLQALQGLPFLTALESLEIGGFSEELDCFPSLDDDDDVMSNHPLFPSLRQLKIRGWEALTSLPHHFQRLTTLKTLSIWYFKNLRELPEWLGDFASLEWLYISNCENLRHLPSKEQMQRLTFLEQLWITQCPQLKERCRRRDGDGADSDSEWPKISHVPRIYIDNRRQ